MKIYNFMMNSGGKTCSCLFEKEEDAVNYVKSLEESQKRLEGHGLVHIFEYGEEDAINSPFFNEGKRVHTSCAINALSEVFTWRVVYEQELN